MLCIHEGSGAYVFAGATQKACMFYCTSQSGGQARPLFLLVRPLQAPHTHCPAHPAYPPQPPICPTHCLLLLQVWELSSFLPPAWLPPLPPSAGS